MLKMFRETGDTGGSAEYWDSAWLTGGVEDTPARVAEPLSRLLERWVAPGSVMLEGGCGHGSYVAQQRGRNVAAVGVDFARRTLSAIKETSPGLPLVVGDVGALPLRSHAVDAYYSGGVVEHFEGGPDDALQEAKRILAPGGVLLVSVPYFSPVRKIMAPFRKRSWVRLSAPVVHTREENEGRVFFQYVYTRGEFCQVLRDCGFRIEAMQGYSILWGANEIPILGKAISARSQSTKLSSSSKQENVSGPEAAPTAGVGLLKRILVEEDSSGLGGSAVTALRWACANMMMYICRAND